MHFGAQRQHVGQIVALGAENVGLCWTVVAVAVVVEMGMMVLMMVGRREHAAVAVVVTGRDCRMMWMLLIVGCVLMLVIDEVLVGGERQLVDAVIRIDDVQFLARLARQIRGLRVAPGVQNRKNNDKKQNTLNMVRCLVILAMV